MITRWDKISYTFLMMFFIFVLIQSIRENSIEMIFLFLTMIIMVGVLLFKRGDN